ncbi:hypothetical protein G4B88_022582 [Cannabis sativa]|uniref:Uncharacterized protein n=1 Tax=Cannabis sativa TaxID=3483 RepID=A0A7J6HXC3_CANSA|nr:hypothetical protein G4B88_022582 [Cannabis sativa]
MIKVVLADPVFISILTILTLTLTHSHKERSTIKLVITTKSVEFMPFFLSFASLLNGITWTTYALIKFDHFITIL